MASSEQQQFISTVTSIVNTILHNQGLLRGEWHLGVVDRVVSSYMLSVKINGSSIAQNIPCNPDVSFAIGDHIMVQYVNGDVRNKFIPYKTGLNTNSKKYNGISTITSGVTSFDVAFNTSRADANYTINPCPSWNTTVWYTNKLNTGFTLNFGTAPASNQTVDWEVVELD